MCGKSQTARETFGRASLRGLPQPTRQETAHQREMSRDRETQSEDVRSETMIIVSTCENTQSKNQNTHKKCKSKTFMYKTINALLSERMEKGIQVHISHADASRQMVATNTTLRKMSHAVFMAGSVLKRVSKLSLFDLRVCSRKRRRCRE